MSMPRSPQLNESGHNDFGREVPPLKDILADQTLSRVLQPMLHGILSRINVPKDMRRDLMDQVLRIIEIGQRLEHVEGNAHELMLGYGVVRGIQEALQDRAQCIMRQIKDSLVEGPTLDLGSGDGEVSNLLRQNGVVNEVTLADVYKHDAIDELDMPFELIDQGEQLPFRDGQFANVLALTAFHHMDRPASMIKEVSRVLAPGGRLVAIESVFDVPFIDIPPDDLTKPGGKLYSRLNASRQFALNVFFDWFYNRVIHFNRDPACKVNVPCNFLPVSGWNREFQNVGLHRAGGEMSGFDIPIVPEFHAQLVAEKSD